MSQRVDCIVLGGGIAGISAAIALQDRGRRVVLVERDRIAAGASFGNAGSIDRDGFVPVGFPRNLREVLGYAGNRRPQMRYNPVALARYWPWLMRLRRESGPDRIPGFARDMNLLHSRAPAIHAELARRAGASDLLSDRGRLRVHRSGAGFAAVARMHALAREHGAPFEILSMDEARELEPALAPVFHKAVLWTGLLTCGDPGALTRAYAGLFTSGGGRILQGDARSLEATASGWRVLTGAGPVAAPDCVLALGAWSDAVLRPLGYRFPLLAKRGYHRAFAQGDTALTRTVGDAEAGYVATPGAGGLAGSIRIATGVEFDFPDRPADPRQMSRVLPLARQLLPLGEARAPLWLGLRPCLPDSRPVVGPAPRHPGLWLHFGHGHAGFGLGPVTARLLAAMICGAPPDGDTAPFLPGRYL